MKTPTGASKRRSPRRLPLSLSAWRKMEGQLEVDQKCLDWQTRLSYWLGAASNSLLARIQQASHADKIRTAVPTPPLFLLGFWRSGTTFLHELFCRDPRFGFPSTYACMNPSHFLLTEKWMSNRTPQQSLRPMDNMRYSWSSPQEDEFALLALGAPSAYEALIVPSLMRNARLLLDPRQRSPEELKRWVDTLANFIRLLTVQQGKTMVLKSPPHGFRLPLLLSLFPQSRYVILERNPYAVFASNLKLWHTLLDLYSVETVAPQEIEEFVLAAYVLHEEAIAKGISEIDPRLAARLRYEELIADPVGCMAKLYEELGLDEFDSVRSRIELHVKSVADHTRNSFRLSAAQKQVVDSAWGNLIRKKGYGWPGDHLALG